MKPINREETLHSTKPTTIEQYFTSVKHLDQSLTSVNSVVTEPPITSVKTVKSVTPVKTDTLRNLDTSVKRFAIKQPSTQVKLVVFEQSLPQEKPANIEQQNTSIINNTTPHWEVIERVLNSINFNYKNFNFVSRNDLEQMFGHITGDLILHYPTNSWYNIGHRQAGAIISKKIGKLPNPQFSKLAKLLVSFADQFTEVMES